MIRCAVVGLGYWGPNLVRNLASGPRTSLVRLCDRDPARLRVLGAQYPAAKTGTALEEVLADPSVDAVAIATPVATHHGIARLALEAGKHVLVEKPLTDGSGKAEELVRIAKERNRVLLVDHVFLYNPAVRKLLDLVRGGELGDLLFIDSVRINLGLFQHDVNVLWDLAPHDLSIVDAILGRLPSSLVAVGDSRAGTGTVDVAYLHLDYGGELLASVHVNWLSPVKVRHFMVGGTRRSVLYNDNDPDERVKVYDRGVDVSRDPEERTKTRISYRTGDVVSPRLEPVEALRLLVTHFAECIEDGAAPISGGEQGLRIVRILEAAEESLARGGARVTL